MDKWYLIFGSLIALVCSVLSLIEKSISNKKDKKSNKYNLIISLFLIGAVIITYFSGQNSLEDKKISDKKRHISDSLNEDYKLKLQNKSDKIIEIQNNNFKLTQKLNDSLINAKNLIINLQNRINNNIVGSKEPCYLVFQTTGEKKVKTILVKEGSLPIYSLSIYITDYKDLLKCKVSNREDKLVIDENCFYKCTSVLSFDLINADCSSIGDYSLPIDKEEGYLEIRFIYKMNVEYLEHLIYKREGSEIKCVANLYKLKGNKYEFVKYINPEKLNWKINFNEIFKLPLKPRYFMPIYWR